MFQDLDGSASGPGKLLQIAREEKNLRIEDVAYEIRLTATQIRALEENDYSRMPEATYVRGYIRNYARLVGISEDEILMSFARANRSIDTNAPATIITGEQTKKTANKKNLWLALATVAIFVLFSAVWVLNPVDTPTQADDENRAANDEQKVAVEKVPLGVSTLNLNQPAESTVSADSGQAEKAKSDQEAGALEATRAESEAGQESPDQASNKKTDSDVPAGINADLSDSTRSELSAAESNADTSTVQKPAQNIADPVSAESEQNQSTLPVTAENADAADKGSLIIFYKKDSWTDVRDATGKKLLYRTVKKGEKIALAGELPMSLFFGFAQGVTVSFNGKDIDVSTYTRGVFARFTVGSAATP